MIVRMCGSVDHLNHVPDEDVTSRDSRPPGFSFPLDPSPGGLPVLHSRFPSGQFGTPRYCTTRSLYRGKDETRKRARSMERLNQVKPDDKEMLELKLPDLLFRDSEEDVRSAKMERVPEFGRNYVSHYKRMLKQRGLKLEQIYKQNRIRLEPTEKKPSRRLEKLESVDSSEFDLNSDESEVLPSLGVNDKSDIMTSHDRLLLDGNLTFGTLLAASPRVRPDRQEEDYELPSGVKEKRRSCGRKLGNIVSSHRLSQLLDSTNPIQTENFYNHYPS